VIAWGANPRCTTHRRNDPYELGGRAGLVSMVHSGLRFQARRAVRSFAGGDNPRCTTQVGFLDAQQRRGPRRPLVAGAIALKGQNNLARGKACELPASHAATPGCDRGNPLPVPRAGGFRRQHAARGRNQCHPGAALYSLSLVSFAPGFDVKRLRRAGIRKCV